jgi:hypothetical protein
MTGPDHYRLAEELLGNHAETDVWHKAAGTT